MLNTLKQFPYLGIMERSLKVYQQSVLDMYGIKPVNSNKKRKHNKRKKK